MISVLFALIFIIAIGITLTFITKENMKKEVKKQNRGRKIIISIGIAILFVMFIAYAIESIYPSPVYEDYCPAIGKEIFNITECEANNGTWQEYPKPIEQNSPQGYCDTYSRCYEEYNKASEPYNRNVFFIALSIGIIALLISFIPAVETVSLGFMSGSILLIIYGTIRYWGALSNIWKTIMIGFALAVLVWIAYKKLK